MVEGRSSGVGIKAEEAMSGSALGTESGSLRFDELYLVEESPEED